MTFEGEVKLRKKNFSVVKIHINEKLFCRQNTQQQKLCSLFDLGHSRPLKLFFNSVSDLFGVHTTLQGLAYGAIDLKTI